MATLNSDFESADLDVLLEAMDEWEKVGGEQLSIIKFLELIPEDLVLREAPDEMKEAFLHFKKTHLSKKREVEQKRKMRSERSTIIKAKIILKKQDDAMDQLGDPADLNIGNSSNSPPENSPPASDQPKPEDLPPSV